MSQHAGAHAGLEGRACARVAPCPTTECVVCSAVVFACELDSCPVGHLDGGQLTSGGWCCSEKCWESATAWPPPMDRALRLARLLLAVAIFAGALVYYLGTPLPLWLALPLAGILAGLIVGLLLLAEAAPAKGPGQVTGGRR